jgi:hypothetical protein
MAEQKETTKAAKSETVIVEFPNGQNEKGETIYREQEVGREIAEAELAKPETADKIKERDPVKLRNSAWKGARLKK